MPDIKHHVKRLLRDFPLFCRQASGISLRLYQQQAALAIIDSVIQRKGLTFVVIFPRQSGKNELQAQIETYLLTIYSQLDAEIVKISPTWKPQSINAMRRLERVLERNLIAKDRWTKEAGYTYKVGQARISFLSGAPTSNVVGATASLLLECDEAQDVLISKWDKEVKPMAAITNATRIFWGTAWTSQTLLAREKRAALEKEKKDGVRRVFEIDADVVGAEVPAYLKFVSDQIARYGRSHPFVKSQYFSQEVDAESGMFPTSRLALMRGSHACALAPQLSRLIAFMIDVAGEDECAKTAAQFDNLSNNTMLGSAERDATALTIVEVDLSTLDDELMQGPRYLVHQRRMWVGAEHSSLFGQIKALAELWEPRYIVVDATGVGAGLASFLGKAFPGRVLPLLFTRKSKSDLGWNFISLIETGRYKEHARSAPTPDQAEVIRLQDRFWRECSAVQMEILPGPERRLRWSVPDGSRDAATGELLHDDLVISAAMCSLLDKQSWGLAESRIIQAFDPLEDMRL